MLSFLVLISRSHVLLEELATLLELETETLANLVKLVSKELFERFSFLIDIASDIFHFLLVILLDLPLSDRVNHVMLEVVLHV